MYDFGQALEESSHCLDGVCALEVPVGVMPSASVCDIVAVARGDCSVEIDSVCMVCIHDLFNSVDEPVLPLGVVADHIVSLRTLYQPPVCLPLLVTMTSCASRPGVFIRDLVAKIVKTLMPFVTLG